MLTFDKAAKCLGLGLCVLMSFPVRAGQPAVDPDNYPAADEKEFGQLRWVLKLGDQDLADFTNFQQVDDAGVSADRYSIAFSAYFLAAEQYHKFPAWRGPIQRAFDRFNQKMLQKRVWEYWYKESPGVPKFEPDMDRPYPATKDPVAYRNIMYSGHIGMMINLYQSLYDDKKWDKPGSIVFEWDENTKFVYDNKSLQEVMFLQMMNNPVPGIECEPNAIFPACNQHPILSWLLYDKMHGSRYFAAASPLFEEFFKKDFINPETKDIGAFYLVKQGIVFSAWNPRYGNKMDSVIEQMVKNGAEFSSGGNDGWIATFMHAWNPELVKELYPYMKKSHVRTEEDGSVVLVKDSLLPDSYYGFFTALAAEVGDEPVKKGLLASVDRMFEPVSQDGTYHYPFVDRAAAVDVGAAGSSAQPARPDETKNDVGLMAGGTIVNGVKQGDAANMRTFPLHSDLSDRLIGLARALPKNGLWQMYNEPFDNTHFSSPYITDVDEAKLPLKRAVYDAKNGALVVSTFSVSANPTDQTFAVENLDAGAAYKLFIDGAEQPFPAKVETATITVNTAKPHDIVLQKSGEVARQNGG